MIETELLPWLTNCPAGDGNFKNALKRASFATLGAAVHKLQTEANKQTVIDAITAEIRRREKEREALPKYLSNATSEERQRKLEWMREQIEMLYDQEKEGIPLMKAKIKCECGVSLFWWKMIKCLFCSVFYCPDCAEKHFGMRRDQEELLKGDCSCQSASA